jgi:hypothetical protein
LQSIIEQIPGNLEDPIIGDGYGVDAVMKIETNTFHEDFVSTALFLMVIFLNSSLV